MHHMRFPSVYERMFPRWRPRADLRPRGVGQGAPLRLSWLGTAGYVIESPGACVLVDPFLTRGSLLATALKPIVPDEDAIRRHLPPRVDAVLCGHSHYDHVADAPLAARLTGAKLVGSASTCAWGRAAGLPEAKLVHVPAGGALVHVGDLEIRFVPSRHGRVTVGPVKVPQLPGEVLTPPRGPGRVMHYKMGGAFGILVRAPGVTLYHNGSADLVDAELEGERADVLVAGLAGRRGTQNYVARLLGALSPRVVIPTHHDAFFAPLERGVHLLPGIDLDGFVSEVALRSPEARVVTPGYLEWVAVGERGENAVIATG